MKNKLPLIARLLLGFVFFAGGITYFLKLVPTPNDLPPALTTFNNGLMASVYFMPLLKGVEVVCGLLLMIGIFVPLALVILAPVVINIILVNVFLAPSGLPIVIVMGALTVYLAFFAPPYAPSIRQLFRK